jgi:L-fuconolactonase
MARIDAHQHFWKYDPVAYDWINGEMRVLQRDFLPPNLAPLLSEMNMEGCVAVQARQSEEETRFLLQLAADFPFVKGVVGWLDLRAPDLEERLDDLQPFSALKGIRHIVQAEPDPDFLLRPDFLRGIKILGKVGLTYDILVYEQQMPAVLQFLERCPDQPMVLDHIGKPIIEGGPSAAWKEGIKGIAAHPLVYCKLSGLVTEADWSNWSEDTFMPFLNVVLEAFGPQRLMVGSDWPVCLLAADQYRRVLEIIERFSADWPEQERRALWGDNAAAFYQL